MMKKSQGNYSGKYFQFHRIRENVKEEEIKSQINWAFWNQQIKPNILNFEMEGEEMVKSKRLQRRMVVVAFVNLVTSKQ